MAYQVQNSEVIYLGKVFRLRRDEIEDRHGQRRHFDIVEHGGAVAMVPIDADDRVWFVRQTRPAVGEVLLEIPAGTLGAGEDPRDCATRELREEIGMSASVLNPLGGFFLAPGYSSEYLHLFEALELSPAPLPPDDDEDLEIVRIPFSETIQMLHQGALKDAKTVAALLLIQARRQA